MKRYHIKKSKILSEDGEGTSTSSSMGASTRTSPPTESCPSAQGSSSTTVSTASVRTQTVGEAPVPYAEGQQGLRYQPTWKKSVHMACL